MTNKWNLLIYRLWAPIYDKLLSGVFLPGRRRAIELLALKPGERVLLVGVGTGADLPLLPSGVRATGIDLSPEMLAKARQKPSAHLADLQLLTGDAMDLSIKAGSYDAAVLNLILSVVPDGAACLRSTLAALRPGGSAVVFDKFLPERQRASLFRRLMNRGSTLMGTDITRRFGDMQQDSACTIVLDEPSIGDGFYRVILLKKNETQSE